MLYPLDKRRNANGQRRATAAPASREPRPPKSGTAPLLRELMAEYAATGLPPAYLAGPAPDTDDIAPDTDDIEEDL